MATKWKKFSRKSATKATAFILIILCLVIGTNSGLDIFLNVQNYESITQSDYMKSNALSSELKSNANRLEYLLRVFKSESYIRSGKTVENLGIKDNWQLTNLYNDFITQNKYEDNSETEALFWQEKSEEIKEIKDIILKSDLSNYEQIINELNNPVGLIYYSTNGDYICTNTNISTKSHYSIRGAYVVIDKNGTEINPNNGGNGFSASLTDKIQSIENGYDRTFMYIAITEDGLESRKAKWNHDRENLTKNITIISICIMVLIVLLTFLIVVAGKKYEDERIHLNLLDKLYADITVLIITGIVLLSIYNFNNVLNIRYTNTNLMKLAMFLCVIIISCMFLGLLLSLVKHIKKGTVVKYSFIYIALIKAFKGIRDLILAGPLMFKATLVIFFLMSATLVSSLFFPSTIIVFIIALYIAYKLMESFRKIQEGVRVAKEGNYELKIKIHEAGVLKNLADDINTITDGVKIAVENEVKSEKLKSELITNVSHDIKTPLTSIISYVDLLKREGLQSPNALKYLDVLDKKSNRLKVLTEDLFEAAKATSGSIKPNFEKVNVNALVSQMLGELDEKIIESNLDFKVSSNNDKIFAFADGRLLSRVMENLLSNILKYALKESRVYIDITELDQEIIICFKNVSAYELNIPVDELMERFKRGDESRNSEGNGLGLAIAKSLMEIQKGMLNLSIDGDLFKAEIILNKYFR